MTEEVDHSNDQPVIPDPNFVEVEPVEPVFDPALPAGIAHGEEVFAKTAEGGVVPTGERVVHETDDDDDLIGWHKEAIS